MDTVQISVTVNGRQTGPHTIPAGLAMVDFLHDYLSLTARSSAVASAFAMPVW